MGTAAYMSPEQAAGLPLDARSDVYSFGLVLHELLSGQRPSGTRALGQRPAAEVEPLVPLPDDVPADLRTLVAKALEHEPADRYQSMRDLVVDLRRLARRSGIPTFATTPTPVAAPHRVSLRRGYALAVVALLAAVGWIVRDYVPGAQRSGPAGTTVAVLPFVNEAAATEDEHLSEGLGDGLRARIMELPDVSVTGRASSVRFRDSDTDPPTIASQLGVRVLINGSLRRRGTTLVVYVEALDERGFALGKWERERPERDFLLLQQEIAMDLVAFLAPELAPEVIAATVAPTRESEDANLLVLIGNHFWQEVQDEILVDEEKLATAIDFYRRAIRADATSVAAHSRLARALLYGGDADEAKRHLDEALDLGDANQAKTSAELSDAYYTSALFLYSTRTQAGVEQAYRSAIRLNANNADALGSYAQFLMTHGRPDAADALFQEAKRLEPLQLSRYVDYAEYLALAEDMERVREIGAEIRARFDDARGYRALARLYETTGELDVGIAWGLKAYERDPGNPDAAGQVAELYVRIGEFDKASEFEPELGVGQLYWRQDYERLIDVASELILDTDDPNVDYLLAFALNATGDPQTAIHILEGAGVRFEPGSDYNVPAALTYADALQAVGRDVDARGFAEAIARGERGGVLGAEADPALFARGWWVNTNRACALLQVGNVDEALQRLGRIEASRGLADSSRLEDALCFHRVAEEPRYRRVIAGLRARQETLRERLPMTLLEHGVADVRARTR
jgi:TolB-like protein/cytochrome c-type biogenesis protein CcmH/NrfG